MKKFPIVILTIVILVACYAVHRYIEIMSPAWQVEAAQQAAIDLHASEQNARTDVQAHSERAELLTGFYRGTGAAVVLFLFGWGAVYVWAHYDKRRESWARAVDGTFALQTFKANGQIYVADPNKATFGVFGQNTVTGELITDASLVGPDRQLAYATTVQKTRTVSAGNGGDGIRYAAHAKLLAGAYDKPVSHIPYEQLEGPEDDLATPFQPLTLADAFKQSDRFNWILGQNKNNGALFTVNPKENAHYGVVGATGTGKTAYVGLLLMANALKQKFRVTILDGKGGADWSKYKNLVEYYPLDYSNVAEIVEQMIGEYDNRQALLNTHQVNSIWELPRGVTIPRPTLFLIDEFGAVMDSLKAASKHAYKKVELDLGNLLRLSRGAGMYIVLCDQNPTKWPGTIRANMPMNICFRLGGNIGNAVNEYNLDHLERVGHFQVSGTDYHAWPTYQVIDSVLADVDYKKPKALLTVTDVTKVAGVKGNDSAINSSDSTIAQGGGDKAPSPPPLHDSAIDSSHKNTPVDNSAIDSSDNSGNRGNSTINKAQLSGRPITAKDKRLVENTYAMTKSINETCRLLYGGWTVSRGNWVKEIVNTKGAMQ